MKLALGTVAFGMPYGVAGNGAEVPIPEVREILNLALEAGVVHLDTAQAYGESEKLLGEMTTGENRFQIFTKARPIALEAVTERELKMVKKSFEDSLKRLRRDQIEGLLVHHSKDLLKPGGSKLLDWMVELLDSGQVKTIGISTYDVDDVPEWVWRDYPISWIQLPYNLLDRRIEKSVGFLRSRGVRIQVRSVFLQGLLLMEKATRHRYFNRWVSVLDRVARQASSEGVSPAVLALQFACRTDWADAVVMGVQRVQEWREILAAWNCKVALNFEGLASDDVELLEPFRWQLAP